MVRDVRESELRDEDVEDDDEDCGELSEDKFRIRWPRKVS